MAGANSATLHYLRAARAAVRAKPFDLASAAKPWSTRLVSTSWSCRQATGRDTKNGLRKEQTLRELACERAEIGDGVAPKGAGPVHTLAITSAGSGDAECLARTGLFLDSDFSGAWDRLLGALNAAHIAHLAQRRDGKKFHVIVPYAKPLLTGKNPKAFKVNYCRRLGWLLGIMSELAWPGEDGVYFDPVTSRLCTLEYLYTRRSTKDAAPEMRWNDGLGLDFMGALQTSGFSEVRAVEAAGAREPIRTQWEVQGEAPAPTEGQWQVEPLRAGLMALRTYKAQRRHRSLEVEAQFQLIDRVLRGESFASPHGQDIRPSRHTAIVQLAGMLETAIPVGVPVDVICKLLEPAFRAVDWSDVACGRAAGDWQHGMGAFVELFEEFRSNRGAGYTPRDYAGDNALEAFVSQGKAKVTRE